MNIPSEPTSRDVKKLEKKFDSLYVNTYKFFPPLFFIDIFVGNFIYFAFDERLFKNCSNYNEQFADLTNFCTFLFCIGYVMVVYYMSIWVSVTCFKAASISEEQDS
jgi:hypothetical protein